MMKTMSALFVAGTLLSSLAACDLSSFTASKDPESATDDDDESATDDDDESASGSGDSVGAPECDEVLKRVTAPDCKDKPGMATIAKNRDNWKNGLAVAASKDATIQSCKASMQAVEAVCGKAGAADGEDKSASGSGDSVGAPECDALLKRVTAPDCKDKPGMATIAKNRDNWKRGLAVAASKDATIQSCKASMQAIEAVCGKQAGGGTQAGAVTASGPWDGKAPYRCGGNDDALITGVIANIPSGPAITAEGNCTVTLNNCTITTDKGIKASGNAVVTLIGGELKASDTAIDASGIAKVRVSGAKVSGKVRRSGLAKVTGIN